MDFISFNFWLLFMPAGCIFYYAFNRHVKIQNLILLMLSAAFYMRFSVRKSVFILACMVITYVTGLIVDRYPRLRHPAVICGSVLNIGILVGTKCANLFIRGFNALAGGFGAGTFCQQGAGCHGFNTEIQVVKPSFRISGLS